MLLACALLLMLAYPPFSITISDRVHGFGYWFVLDEPPSNHPRIDIATHLLQLIGVGCIGALFYLAAGPGSKPKPQTEIKHLAELPVELRRDADEFTKLFPEYALLLREDTPVGDRLRRLLEEFGPGNVLVEDHAARMLEKR